MASEADESGLVINIYDPTESSRTRSLQRSAALSHAAKTTYLRRIRAKYPPHKPTQTETKVKEPRKPPSSNGRQLQIKQYIARRPARGNSDPFDSMAVTITPEVSMLLSLWRGHAESNTVVATRWISDTALRQDLRLDNGLHAEALLLLCSALLSSQHPDRQDLIIRRLERKHNCIQQLKRLLQKQPQNGEVFIRGLSLIFMATILVNEPDEAKIHAQRMYQALANLNAAQLWDDPERVIILSRMYYYDQQCALTHMRAPVLDPELPVNHWHGTLAPLHDWIRDRDLVPIPGDVSHPTFSKELEELYGRLQEYITIQCMQVPELLGFLEGHAKSSSVIYSIELTTRFFRHLDYTERQLLGALDMTDLYRWQNESILTLAALAFLVYVKGGPTIFTLREQGTKIMQALQDNIERASSTTSSTENSLVYQNAQLWALFIGSIWEWDSGMYIVGDRWHSNRLRQRIQEMNVKSWAGLKEIMYSFLYIPPAKHGETTMFLEMDRDAILAKVSGSPPTGMQFVKSLLFPIRPL